MLWNLRYLSKSSYLDSGPIFQLASTEIGCTDPVEDLPIIRQDGKSLSLVIVS